MLQLAYEDRGHGVGYEIERVAFKGERLGHVGVYDLGVIALVPCDRPFAFELRCPLARASTRGLSPLCATGCFLCDSWAKTCVSQSGTLQKVRP